MVSVLNGRADIYPPTEDGKYWKIVWYDRITGKRRNTTFKGKNQKAVIARARELIGDYTPSKKGDSIPTVTEIFESWMRRNQPRWSSRTYDQYYYQANKYILENVGHLPVTQVTPDDFSAIDVTHLSRGQQTKVKSLVKGTMTEAVRWIHGEPEDYSEAIFMSGSKSEARERSIDGTDVMPAKIINDIINACYATCQIHPVLKNTSKDNVAIDMETGTVYNADTGGPTHQLLESDPGLQNWIADNGLPAERMKHRRSIPKHYTNKTQRRMDETEALAKRYRMFALSVGLAAGVGLRIGEILALRVRDFVENDPNKMIQTFDWDRQQPETANQQLIRWGYNGRLKIDKQASQRGKGSIVLSRPKYDTVREVFIPAVLYQPNETVPYVREPRRTQVIETGLTDFKNEDLSLWSMTEKDALGIWHHETGTDRGGMIPLGWLLMYRLNDLWDDLHKGLSPDAPRRFDDFQKLLMFPTRSQPRKTGKGREIKGVEIPNLWREDPALVEGFGGYASTANFARVYTNPIFDFVTEQHRIYPANRQNLPEGKRKGWTFHSLRHFFVTSNIYHGIPLPEISKMAGHASIEFTMSQYSHAMQQDYSVRGFE